MAQKQKYHEYKNHYSGWHRTASIMRFAKDEKTARDLSMMDIDQVIWMEWDVNKRQPVALIETAEIIGKKTGKSTWMLEALCKRANLLGYLVMYKLYEDMRVNPADSYYCDIEYFVVTQKYPKKMQAYQLTPKEYAEMIIQWRQLALNMVKPKPIQLEYPDLFKYGFMCFCVVMIILLL